MSISKSRDVYLRWRNRFVLKLALYHFALVLLFDLLAIYAPTVFSSSIFADSAYTIGLVFALFIVVSVITSTFYYSYRITEKESKFLPGVR
ncbi:MAG: DUF485 domain-containing protein [Gammaproteobacteria bacterium]|nr:DUF485 domain-containing protein [Gammaproteobacteria bacterium]